MAMPASSSAVDSRRQRRHMADAVRPAASVRVSALAARLADLHRTLRKRLSTRELGRLAARLAVAIPGVGDRLGLSTSAATYADAADRVLSMTEYDDTFAVDAPTAAFLDVYRDELGPLWRGGVLHVAARIGVYAIPDGEIRMATGVLRQHSTGRLLAASRLDDRLKAQRPRLHRERRHIAGAVIPLVGAPTGRGNYYHMLCERFRFVLHALERVPELREATLIVRDNVPGYHEAFCDQLRVAYPRLRIEALPPRVLVTCDELVAVQREEPHPIGHFAGAADFRALRAAFRAAYGISDAPLKRRIWLSRASIRKRHVLNEAEVLAALEPLGVELVEPQLLSHREQVAMFGEAELITGPAGAAYTNLIFASPGAKLVEVCPPDLQEPFFVATALQAGMRYRHVFGERSKLYESFEVDPAAVVAAVTG